LLLKHETRKAVGFLRIEVLKDFNVEESQASFVKDYVIFNLLKRAQGYWESSGILEKSDSFEDFGLIFAEIEQAVAL